MEMETDFPLQIHFLQELELDTTYLKKDMLPEGVGETVGQDGIYFVSYYSDNKTRPQTGASSFVENFNVASNSISFDIKSLQFYGKNVKVVVYYAVKVTKDISSVVGGSDVEFTNNCCGNSCQNRRFN